MKWNFNVNAAPRPAYGEPTREILIVIKGQRRAIVSRWIPDDHSNRDGRWLNLKTGEEIGAWCEITYPVDKAPVVSLPPGL